MDKVMGILGFLAARLKEPSTHAAIASAGMLVGMNVSDQMVTNTATVVSAVFSVMGIFFKEKSA